MLREIEDAVPVLEQAGDDEGLAMAEVVRFHARDRAVSRIRRSGCPSRSTTPGRRARAQIEHHVMGWICITLPRGTVPVDEAIAASTEIVETLLLGYVHASALGALGLLRASKGEFEEARALVEEVDRMLEELGLRQAAAAHSIAIGEVEMMAGDDTAAEQAFRNGFDSVTRARRRGLLQRTSRGGSGSCSRGRGATTRQSVRARSWNTPGPAALGRRLAARRLAARGGAPGRPARAGELVAEASDRMTSAAGERHACRRAARVRGGAADGGTRGRGRRARREAAGIAERLGYIVARRRAEEVSAR